MNLPSVVVLAGVIADGWLLAFVAIRGRRPWLQTTYAACAASFLVTGVAFLGTSEGVLPAVRQDVVVGIMLLSHALTAILVLSLIHGETLVRQRGAAFLLLGPVPLLAYLAPSQGWTPATAYEGNVVGGFLVLCLGIALAEAIYARYTSRLHAGHAFWLSLGVVALIVAGPLYTYELPSLGETMLDGANAAAPFALACFALVAFQADPWPLSVGRPRGRTTAGAIRVADTIVFEEERPKYAFRTADEESSSGRSTLILSRMPPPIAASGTTFAAIAPSRHAAVRALTTASEFLAGSPGGLVVLDGLADLSAMSGWRPSLEAVVRMRHAARGTGSTVLLSTSRLTDSERNALRPLALPWWTLPDPAREIEAILTSSFGGGATRLLDSFCRAHSFRPEDVTTGHVPALVAFLDRALADLSGAVAGTAAHGLRVQFEAASSVLRSFAAQRAEEVARGKWPSRKASDAGTDLIVTAADYWKDEGMGEFLAAANSVPDREPLFEKARTVFVEQLGDAGEGVLRTQLARLGKRPEEIERTDLARIADRATVDLGTLADVIDVPQEKDRIARQIESIRLRLERLAEGNE